MNLLEYKRDNHNKDYFRAVRNDNSMAKKVGTYAVSSVIVGGLAGAVFLFPAIAPIVASPTLLTALAYSGNLVLAGVAGGAGYGLHRAVMHKDNKLSKAEKSIEKAAKIEKKLNKYRDGDRDNISDRKYSKLTRQRDRKLMYFDTVHDIYHRKVDKLATKLGYKLSDGYIKDRTAKPFVAETDTAKLAQVGSNAWMNARREKKLIKSFEKLDDLHEDYLDYLGISGNDLSVVEDYSNNLDKRRIINRTRRGLTTLKNKVYNPESAAERAKRKAEREAEKERTREDKDRAREDKDRARGEEKEKKDTARRTRQETREEERNKKKEEKERAREEKERAREEQKAKRKEEKDKRRNEKETGYDYYDFDKYNREEEAGFGAVAPQFVKSFNEMSIFDQMVIALGKQEMSDPRVGLVRYNNGTMECIQPRYAFDTLSTKGGYMKALKKESVSYAPFPISEKVSGEDAIKYYEKAVGNEVGEKMENIDKALIKMNKQFEKCEEYLDAQGVDTRAQNSEILVQLDFDNPKYSTHRTFDDVQKAIAYTQFVEATARRQMQGENCDAYRITTWSKEGDNAYTVTLPFCGVVTDKQSMKEDKTRFNGALIDEVYNLYRNEYIFHGQKTKAPTADIIKTIYDAVGENVSEKTIADRLRVLTEQVAASAIYMENETFRKRAEEFNEMHAGRDSSHASL